SHRPRRYRAFRDGSARLRAARCPITLKYRHSIRRILRPPNGLSEGDGSAACERGETRMHLSGHRAIRVLVVFLVLALGVAALLPLIARGASQINGVISTCGTTTPYVVGAT